VETHGIDCNCEDCWWAHGCEVVDEFGIPLSELFGVEPSRMYKQGKMLEEIQNNPSLTEYEQWKKDN
jgi:hypothetical protein